MGLGIGRPLYLWGLDTTLDLCARTRRSAGVRPVHEAPCCVDGRLLLSSAPSHQELHQVVASWGCEGGCRRFCHFEPARRRACVPPGRTPVGPQCRSEAHLQQEEVWPRHNAPPRCSPLAASPIPHRVQALFTRQSRQSLSRALLRHINCRNYYYY